MTLSSALSLALLGAAYIFCCSPALADTQPRKIAINNPKVLKQLTTEALEKGRSLPETPPLGTSTYHLARLAKQEVEAAQRLTRMAQTLLEVHKVISRYLSSWEELAEAEVGVAGWVEHPLHAYALTKHVSLGWPALEDAVSHLKDLTPDVDWLLERRNTTGVATQEDLTTVASGLGRLHDFYTFNLTAFSDAHLTSHLSLQPVPASITPTVWDLYRIGTEAARVNIWNSGVDFLRAALERHNISSISSSSSSSSSCPSLSCQMSHPFDDADDILQLPKVYKKVTKMHDQVLERKGSRTRNHSTHQAPLDRTLARKKKYHKKQETIAEGKIGTPTQGQTLYRRLCRGEDLRPRNVTSHLYCRYLSNGSPMYLIGPLRMEVHSLSPYVVTIEGVVTSSQAHGIQEIASAFLEQSSTFRYNGQSEVSFQRTSSTAWLWEHNSKFMPILTARIEALTGLNTIQHEGAEAYQVVNYGVGGHYTVHHDAVSTSLLYNRIATFLIYLTDVTQGGATVFPWVGVSVQPKKGMALLWYNLDRAGIRDGRLEHAACPVLIGDKWVINKWVQYGGQMDRVLCAANDREANIVQPLF